MLPFFNLTTNNNVFLYARYSTGFLPLKIPLAFLLNIPLCFLPFSDNKIIRNTWMPGIRNRLEHRAIVQEGSEGYKY